MKKADWRDVVKRGRELVADDHGRTKFELGDLALEVAPMGEGHGRTGSMETLSEFAEEIGVPLKTLAGYRGVSAAWPDTTRAVSATWTTHRALMGEPDRAELIGSKEWTPEALREIKEARKPRKLGLGRDEKWWLAEKEAVRQLRVWTEKRIAGLSKAEAKRRAEFMREAIELHQEIAEALETYSYTRSL